MTKIEFSTYGNDWTDLPLYQVLYEWIMKNISIPNDMSVIVAYIALIFIAWYIMMWVTRFIIGIIWPLFLLGTALILFRLLQSYEPEDLADMIIKTITIVADTLTMPVAVRLVEVLTLITLLGILTGISIFVVLAQRASFALLLIVTPLTYIINGIFYVAEKVLVATLSGLLGVTNSVSENMI